MAAKLKKRALAEYQTQVEGAASREEVRAAVAPTSNTSQKRLKLALQHSVSASKSSSDPSSAAVEAFPIDRIDASGADITALIISFIPKIKARIHVFA